MSSSRKPRDSRRERASTSRTSYYPTQWCEWEWSEQRSCWQRYRLKAKGEYEFEYDKKQTSTEPRTPQTTGQLDPIQEATGSYPSQSSNYTHAPIAEVTEILDRTKLGSSSTAAGATLALGGSWAPTGPIPNLIKPRDPHTSQEEFDPHYKVHGAWEFKYGKVFKILWAEPGGNNDNGSFSGGQSVSERKGQFGEKLFQKVRRFVIIDPRQGHCICLPINTYSGQGANKRGVQAKDHTIIYTGKNPVMIKGEQQKGLTKIPIKMNPASPRHKLDNASRLNYAKPYTVEYNVKVWFIGEIHADYQWQLGTDYNIVNPPVQPRGLPPPTASQDAYGHTGGGFASSSESNSFNPYATATSLISTYATGSGYTVPSSSFSSTTPTSTTRSSTFQMSPAPVVPQDFRSIKSHTGDHGDGKPLSRYKSHEAGPESEEQGHTENAEQPTSPMPIYEPHQHHDESAIDDSFASRENPELSLYSTSYSSRPDLSSRATAPEYPVRTPSYNSEHPTGYFSARSSSFDANAFPEYGTRVGRDKRWQASSERSGSTRPYVSPSREEAQEPEHEAEPEPEAEAEPKHEHEHEEENLYNSD